MKKSDIKKMPEYFNQYIHFTDDVTYLEALQISLQELEQAPKEKWKAINDKTYALGKWTVKDIFQHLIDTERVFVYRITAIARGDKQQMPSFDEDIFAKNAIAKARTIDNLLDELMLVRKGTIAMYQSFTPEMLHQIGNGFNGIQYCPLSLGFMLAGHQRWHFKVIEDKYFSLI
jgi:hypothetical protein